MLTSRSQSRQLLFAGMNRLAPSCRSEGLADPLGDAHPVPPGDLSKFAHFRVMQDDLKPFTHYNEYDTLQRRSQRRVNSKIRFSPMSISSLAAVGDKPGADPADCVLSSPLTSPVPIRNGGRRGRRKG